MSLSAFFKSQKESRSSCKDWMSMEPGIASIYSVRLIGDTSLLLTERRDSRV